MGGPNEPPPPSPQARIFSPRPWSYANHHDSTPATTGSNMVRSWLADKSFPQSLRAQIVLSSKSSCQIWRAVSLLVLNFSAIIRVVIQRSLIGGHEQLQWSHLSVSKQTFLVVDHLLSSPFPSLNRVSHSKTHERKRQLSPYTFLWSLNVFPADLSNFQ